MLEIKKILLPVDVPLASLAELHQAATLAHQFHSEILLLHVVTPRSLANGVPADSYEQANWDLLAAVLDQARKQGDTSLEADLRGLTINWRLVKGDTAAAIVHTAQEQGADLIVMPSHSFTFYQFLLGSVTTQVLHGSECPVWTGAHRPESPERKFAIRSVLCAVEFSPRAAQVVSWASGMATAFGARLTLANVTAGVELWGAGGNYVDQKWKEELLANANQQMAKLQRQLGLKVDVMIGSGDAPGFLAQAVQKTEADLLVSTSYPYGDRLRTHGYGIISAVPIPVLSV